MSAVKRSAALTAPPSVVVSRHTSLDGYRGLAIVSMLIDHLTMVTAGPLELRYTLGRFAMPMFFLLAGHLARRPRLRHAGIGALGVALPMFVPWIDSPNVLTLWAVGVLVLWAVRFVGLSPLVLVGLALILGGNGWGFRPGSGYEWSALWGLMALGAVLPRAAFDWTARLPARVLEPLATVGRHPILWYAGHLCALQVILLAVYR